jgi:hypothetical protein
MLRLLERVVTHYQNYHVWLQNITTYLTTAEIFAQIRKGDTSNTKQHQSLEIRGLQFVKKKNKVLFGWETMCQI